MKKNYLNLMSIVFLACLFTWIWQGPAQAKQIKGKLRSITQADRKAAVNARKAKFGNKIATNSLVAPKLGVTAPTAMPDMNMPMTGAMPHYFGPYSNWANSPPLRKFVDSLPGLGAANANKLGQYLPIAVADLNSYSGSDYYEIGLVQYTEKMHSDLPPTTLRGYVQLNDPANPATRDANGKIIAWPTPHYLGPIIIAQKDRPVRIKFTNLLPTGAGGDLFIPVDTTGMGAGMGPLDMPGMPGMKEMYTQNRGTLHLHGGLTPWISDGTPHQWTTPADEMTQYPKGVSVSNVPDMPEPGDGSMTFFYSNQQSARLMFYHDHAYGITRLNVYAGEAAGYLITDPNEQELVNAGIIPDEQIPLIIQDKTFVDADTINLTDPTWNWGSMPGMAMTGDLWFPHVYMPNQNPYDFDGVNPLGRWDYGPWFWPPWPATVGEVNNPYYDPMNAPWEPPTVPGLPDVSMTMEAFHDTPLVNGTAYPYLEVQPKAYRFRILNAANDRFWNLQIHQATPLAIAITSGGTGYTAPVVSISPPPAGGIQAAATATTSDGVVTAIWITNPGSGYITAPAITIEDATGTGATAVAGIGLDDVKMVQAATGNWPAGWPTMDLRDGGIPDPAWRGPDIIQIGTEGGFLPAPVKFNNKPIGWDMDSKSMTVGNIKEHNLFLGCAERADVIVDFSAFAGKTLILYNDAPAAVPASDPRLDYYTGKPDLTDTGGNGTTLPGYGPNIRTIMQIRVADTTPAATYNLTALEDAFKSTATTQGVFAKSQNPIIVPQAGYNSAYNANFPAGLTAYERIQNTSLTFNPMDLSQPNKLSPTSLTIINNPKAIAEEFENEYGRMSGFLGVEVPFTNGQNQTTIFYGYIDPASEIINDNMTPMSPVAGDGTQIWKITHNGVDTHPVHFHLFDVQLINRVDWAGVVKPPELNELGWKETVRMNPLEDCIVALRPVAPKLTFGVPDSVRPLNPTMPLGDPMGFKNVDTQGNPVVPPIVNQLVNFGWEYVWHCHILSHEEMDMMRPVVFNVARTLPTAPVLNATAGANTVGLGWTDATPANDPTTLGNPANEIGFRIERATVINGVTGAYSILVTSPANTTSYSDVTAASGTEYSYKVIAFNAAGESASAPVSVGQAPPVAPSNLSAAVSSQAPLTVTLNWSDNSYNETGFTIQRALDSGFTSAVITTNIAADLVTYNDTAVQVNTTYYYRILAVNAAGNSGWSTANVTTPLPPPAAPANLTAALQTGPRIALTWRDNATNETGFAIERADNGGIFAQIASVGPRTNTGNVTYNDNAVAVGNSYSYRVKALRGTSSSAYTNTVAIDIPVPPAAPGGLIVVSTTAGNGNGNNRTATLRWVDNANNETSFTVQRATNAGFSAGLGTTTIAAAAGTGSNVSTTISSLARRTTYWFHVRSVNAAGTSAWSNVVSVTTP